MACVWKADPGGIRVFQSTCGESGRSGRGFSPSAAAAAATSAVQFERFGLTLTAASLLTCSLQHPARQPNMLLGLPPAAQRAGSVALLAAPSCQARSKRPGRKGDRQAAEAIEEAAIRRRLQRRPLRLTTHAEERLAGRWGCRAEAVLNFACVSENTDEH